MRNLSFPGMAKNTFLKCVFVVAFLSVFVRFLFFFLPPSFATILLYQLSSQRRQPPQQPCCLYHDLPESKSDYFSSRYFMHEESQFEVAMCA